MSLKLRPARQRFTGEIGWRSAHTAPVVNFSLLVIAAMPPILQRPACQLSQRCWRRTPRRFAQDRRRTGIVSANFNAGANLDWATAPQHAHAHHGQSVDIYGDLILPAYPQGLRDCTGRLPPSGGKVRSVDGPARGASFSMAKASLLAAFTGTGLKPRSKLKPEDLAKCMRRGSAHTNPADRGDTTLAAISPLENVCRMKPATCLKERRAGPQRKNTCTSLTVLTKQSIISGRTGSAAHDLMPFLFSCHAFRRHLWLAHQHDLREDKLVLRRLSVMPSPRTTPLLSISPVETDKQRSCPMVRN